VIAKLVGMRRRYVWAQAVQHLVDSASRSASAAQFPQPEWEAPLPLSTKVVRACRPELLAQPPVIEPVDVLAAKLPG
jgi:hypothetical protein